MALTNCPHCAHQHVCHNPPYRDQMPALVTWLQEKMNEPDDPLELAIVTASRRSMRAHYGYVLDKIQELEGMDLG